METLEKEMAASVANYELRIRAINEENVLQIKAREKEINDFKNQAENQKAFEKEKSGLESKIKQLNEDVAEQKK